MNARADGFSLLEALAALTLTALLAALLIATSVAQMRLARTLSSRAASLDAVRTVSWVIGGEIRRSRFADVRAVAADSLALRSFRGRGIPCDGGTEQELVVRYRGDRLPNPDKDSLLLIGAGPEQVAALTAVHDGGGCASSPGERILRLGVAHAGSAPSLVLVFESGAYHLSSRALRYRSGGEGRQPITAEVLGSSRFLGLDSQAVRFRLAPDGLPVGDRAAFHPAGARE